MTRSFRDISQYQNGASITLGSATLTLGTLLTGRGLAGLAAPYTLVIQTPGSTNREVVNVTSTASFPTLSIDRGQAGTAAATHDTTELVTQVVAETDLQNFAQLDGAQQTGIINITGDSTGATHKANGLTGSTANSRYAGGTTSGAPASGTFAKGDYVIDQTGSIWVCSIAGTPGTWIQVGATTAGEAISSDIKVNGLTGATAASRYVGGTTSGAPVSGTFAKGDFVIDQTAVIWVCTTAGSPGTWVQIAGSSGVGPSLDQVDAPAAHGLLGWTVDPTTQVANTAAATTQRLHLNRVYIPTSGTAGHIYVWMTAFGATLTTNGNFVGIYDTSYNLLATSAAQDTAWVTGTGTTGLQTIALTSSVGLTGGSSYYLALIASGTTPPTFAKPASLATGLTNVGQTATAPATARALSHTAAITALPNPATLQSTDVFLWWMAVGT